MGIMGLSCLNNQKIFDEFRSIWVAATPEELIRQTLLKMLSEKLGFPKELIAVEKELSQLPHLAESDVPPRRLDILCYGKNIHPNHSLYPLLLIECKRGNLDGSAQEQLLGYNYYVQASFVAIAAKNGILFAYPSEKGGVSQFLSFIPSYQQLLQFLDARK